MKSFIKLIFPIAALTLLTPTLHAKNKDGGADKAAMEAQMMEVMKRGAPSTHHEVFSPLVGTWKVTTKMWMAPGQKADKSEAMAENELINGGRFLKQTYKGDWGGAPYVGIGYTGYDNIREEYENIWLDNFTTGMMKAVGSYDAKSKTLSFTFDYSCTMTGEKNKWARSEWKVVNKNKNVYKSYSKDADGKEFLAMEIIYKRAK